MRIGLEDELLELLELLDKRHGVCVGELAELYSRALNTFLNGELKVSSKDYRSGCRFSLSCTFAKSSSSSSSIAIRLRRRRLYDDTHDWDLMQKITEYNNNIVYTSIPCFRTLSNFMYSMMYFLIRCFKVRAQIKRSKRRKWSRRGRRSTRSAIIYSIKGSCCSFADFLFAKNKSQDDMQNRPQSCDENLRCTWLSISVCASYNSLISSCSCLWWCMFSSHMPFVANQGKDISLASMFPRKNICEAKIDPTRGEYDWREINIINARHELKDEQDSDES